MRFWKTSTQQLAVSIQPVNSFSGMELLSD